MHAEFEDDGPAIVGTGCDLVVSAQSIHHVEGALEKTVSERALAVLASGGRLLLADRLAVEPALFDPYAALWRRTREELGLRRLPHDWTYARYVEKPGEGGDVPDLLPTQLAWLREVGFDPVTSCREGRTARSSRA